MAVFSSKERVVCELNTGKMVIKGTRTPSNLYVLKGGQEQRYLGKSS